MICGLIFSHIIVLLTDDRNLPMYANWDGSLCTFFNCSNKILLCLLFKFKKKKLKSTSNFYFFYYTICTCEPLCGPHIYIGYPHCMVSNCTSLIVLIGV